MLWMLGTCCAVLVSKRIFLNLRFSQRKLCRKDPFHVRRALAPAKSRAQSTRPVSLLPVPRPTFCAEAKDFLKRRRQWKAMESAMEGFCQEEKDAKWMIMIKLDSPRLGSGNVDCHSPLIKASMTHSHEAWLQMCSYWWYKPLRSQSKRLPEDDAYHIHQKSTKRYHINPYYVDT